MPSLDKTNPSVLYAYNFVVKQKHFPEAPAPFLYRLRRQTNKKLSFLIFLVSEHSAVFYVIARKIFVLSSYKTNGENFANFHFKNITCLKWVCGKQGRSSSIGAKK